MELLQSLLSAVFQLFLISLIPTMYYLLKYKKITGFFSFIGIKKPPNQAILYAILLAVIFFISSNTVYYIFGIFNILKSPETLGGNLRQLGPGFSTFLIIIIQSVFATGLWEEIIFRGFIGKRLISKFGFIWGNGVQALVFGLLHGIMLFNTIGFIKTLIIVLITGAIGYMMGYLNEKIGRGSIIPSWIAHSLSNVMAFSFIVFMV